MKWFFFYQILQPETDHWKPFIIHNLFTWTHWELRDPLKKLSNRQPMLKISKMKYSVSGTSPQQKLNNTVQGYNVIVLFKTILDITPAHWFTASHPKMFYVLLQLTSECFKTRFIFLREAWKATPPYCMLPFLLYWIKQIKSSLPFQKPTLQHRCV